MAVCRILRHENEGDYWMEQARQKFRFLRDDGEEWCLEFRGSIALRIQTSASIPDNDDGHSC